MNVKLSYLFGAYLLLTSAFQVQNDNVLDLTKSKTTKTAKQERTSGTVGGALSFSSADPPRPSQFKITLLSIDKSKYQLGEQVIYEIEIQNVSESSVVVPWSDAPAGDNLREKRNASSSLEASITLVVKDDISGDQFIAGRRIYGSSLVPGSLKSLKPGEKARIRALGHWIFHDADVAQRMLKKLPQTLEVRAYFSSFHGGGSTIYNPATSANSLTVDLKRRQQE